MSDYKVSIPSPEEAEAALQRLRAGNAVRTTPRPELTLYEGVSLHGAFEITARDAKSGEVEWDYKGTNLITDFGRRYWMDARFSTIQVGFAASTEPPTAARSAISGDINQIFASGNLSPSNNSVTHTKTVSTTFGTPASNRTLGTIFLQRVNDGVVAQSGTRAVIAYALLTPPKTQTTTQTLEVVYKISMSPIY